LIIISDLLPIISPYSPIISIKYLLTKGFFCNRICLTLDNFKRIKETLISRRRQKMFSKQDTVLVVDDERSVIDLLSENLAEAGYKCVTSTTGEEALQRLSMGNFDAVLLDLRLPGISGMDVLREAVKNCPGTEVIIVTAIEDVQTAVEAMKIGAVDYITKPFELERVNDSLEAALKEKTVGSSQPTPKETGDNELDWMRYIDDIANGVETRLDSLTGHVMATTIIERTKAIAQSLGILEEWIDKWVDGRRKNMERVRILDSLLEKAGQSPLT
jgi:FixJ family two-component response regulator